MGSNHGKQHSKKDNNKNRLNIKKVLRFQSFRTSKLSRPVSYAGTNQYYEEHNISTRPLSMYDAVLLPNSDISEINNIIHL